MRLLVCAGGTGGGVYPALAVLQAAQSEWRLISDDWATPDTQPAPQRLSVLWVGSQGGMEESLVKRQGIAYTSIPAAGVHGVGMRALPRNLIELSRGYSRSKVILDEFKPDVLFFTGGYVAVPMALAGRSTPSMVFVPDIEPALALKFLSLFSDQIVVTAEESLKFFSKSKDVTVTGYPVREDLNTWELDKAYRVLGLQKGLPTLLVFGGSKGARSINKALIHLLPELLPEMQIIHITGKLDWPEMQTQMDRLPQRLASSELTRRYKAFPYLHEEMGAAFTVADLVVARAGASTLGEFPRFGLPAILIPYPYAWKYQQVNAEYLQSRGAAVIIADEQLNEKLSGQIRELMHDEPKRKQMSTAMRALDHPMAAKAIFHLLLSLAEAKGKKE